MRTVAAILLTFLVRCVYLHPAGELNFNKLSGLLDFDQSTSCIFGPKYVSMNIYNRAIPNGKNIGEKESCNYVDPSLPIVFLVHGFISYGNETNTYDLAKQLVKKNYTVFSLDWSEAACKDGIPILRLGEYPFAVKNTREIGELMATYVISLIQECETPLDNITFVGHSLGAHVCGFAAKHIRESGNGTVTRIIGADPAAPLFDGKPCEERLCKTDAIHVLIIHTSILGIPKPMGQVDMYFNGGQKQPDCGLLDANFVCAHSKSIVYLVYLFDKCVYPAVQTTYDESALGRLLEGADVKKPPYPTSNTTNCAVVTENIFKIKASTKVREGVYYVFVESEPPYCTQQSFRCEPLAITAK